MPKSPPNAAADSPRFMRRRTQSAGPFGRPPDTPSRSSGTPVEGIITPEMEFIAIRENLGRAKIAEMSQRLVRDDLDKQHAGSTQLASQGRLTTIAANGQATSPPSSAAFRSASPPKSPRNSSATKSPPAAPSSRPTSITRNASR